MTMRYTLWILTISGELDRKVGESNSRDHALDDAHDIANDLDQPVVILSDGDYATTIYPDYLEDY